MPSAARSSTNSGLFTTRHRKEACVQLVCEGSRRRTRSWTQLIGSRHGGELDESEEGSTKLVVAGGDAPVLLELVEEALDHVALLVELLLPAVSVAGAAGR